MTQPLLLPSPNFDDRVVVIPADHACQDVVPICIRTTDDENRPVHRGWIDAVTPIADALRRMSCRILDDIWRVSEITEASVHALSARRGRDLGRSPSRRIYVDARWRAWDLRSGSQRQRRGGEVELTEAMRRALRDPYDFERAFENREFLERLEQQLHRIGRDDVIDMMDRHLMESSSEQIFQAPPNSQTRNTRSHFFHRTLRRALKLL